jgi:hypothetical protein
MRRVIAYVDGFNLYHAVDDLRKPHLKWLDLWALSESLLRNGETLNAVNYFSAYATWLAQPYARHRIYVAALKARGVTAVMARFKKKPAACRKCGATWISHEEKETDVHIAVRLVADAFQDAFDRAILISADSDLAPALRAIKTHKPGKKVFVAAPPGRRATAHVLAPRIEITKGRLERCLLPRELYDGTGKLVARRPTEYDRRT